MNRKHARFGAVVLLLAGLTGCSSSPDSDILGEALDLTVGPSDSADYASIQEAVLAAPAGSSIRIEPGTYTEAIYLNKPLTLTGTAPETVVEYPTTGPSDSAVIEIRDTVGVRIRSIGVRASPLLVDGIRVRGSTSVVLRSVDASHNSGDGIDIRDSSGVDVIDGIFESNGDDGLQVDEGSANVSIISCRATSNVADGIKIRNSTDVLAEDNTSTLNLDDGILVRSSSSVRVIGNSSTLNTSWGIKVINAADTILESNTAEDNGAGNIGCEPAPCP